MTWMLLTLSQRRPRRFIGMAVIKAVAVFMWAGALVLIVLWVPMVIDYGAVVLPLFIVPILISALGALFWVSD